MSILITSYVKLENVNIHRLLINWVLLCWQGARGVHGTNGVHVSRIFKPDHENVQVHHSWDVMVPVSMLGRVFRSTVQVYL